MNVFKALISVCQQSGKKMVGSAGDNLLSTGLLQFWMDRKQRSSNKRRFFSSYPGSGVYSATCPMDTTNSFPIGKVDGE
jgi:hypothetical protein